MLIDAYSLEIFTPPCDPGAERYSAIAHLELDIAAVLPYLNATLSGANFLPSANALTWKKAGHLIAFHADRVAVSNVADRQEALKELERLIELVNRTWERRAEITPDYETKKRAAPTAVYQLLPHTNCRECGEATCMAFAFGLIQGKRSLEDCPLLVTDPAFADRKATLTALL